MLAFMQGVVNGGSHEFSMLIALAQHPSYPFSGMNWDSLALLQGSFGASGPKVGAQPRRPKSRKWSRKWSRKRVKIVEKQSILALFRLRFRLFGPRGRPAPGTHFRTPFPTLGPEGPNDPCSGQKFSQGMRNSPKKEFSGQRPRGHLGVIMTFGRTTSWVKNFDQAIETFKKTRIWVQTSMTRMRRRP